MKVIIPPTFSDSKYTHYWALWVQYMPSSETIPYSAPLRPPNFLTSLCLGLSTVCPCCIKKGEIQLQSPLLLCFCLLSPSSLSFPPGPPAQKGCHQQCCPCSKCCHRHRLGYVHMWPSEFESNARGSNTNH